MQGSPNKQISVAFTVSVVGHLIIFLLLVVFVGLEFQQSISHQPLVVNIEQPESPGEFDRTPDTTTKTTPAEPAQTAKQIEPEKPTDTLTETETDPGDGGPVLADASSVANATTATTLPVRVTEGVDETNEQTAEPGELATDSAEFLTSVQANEKLVALPQKKTEPTKVRSVSMSAKQEKMLQRRAAKWSKHLQNQPIDQDLTWEHKGQQYTARISRQPAKDDMDIEKVLVAVSTMENGTNVSTQFRMKRMAFSNFTQFVNRWDPDVRVHNDELDGRFHSNSEISLLSTGDATPTFRGKVTTASRQINVDDTDEPVWRDDIFLGGLETGVKRIVLPNQFTPFPEDNAVDDDQIHYLDDDTTIHFYSNGTYGWRQTGSDDPEQIRSIGNSTAYLIGTKKKELCVSGVVKGKVLVYSPERIVIEGNLVYAHGPDATGNSKTMSATGISETALKTGTSETGLNARVSDTVLDTRTSETVLDTGVSDTALNAGTSAAAPDDEHYPDSLHESGNYLGLVSDKFIEVAGPDVTGPGDLSIHASMYAKLRFAVKKFRSRENALLYIFGSLTAGTITATEPRYRTKIQFDRRLESRRPPGFPVTNRYEIESWQPTWNAN